MRIKIISDGTPEGTRIVDAESGEMVEDVTSVRWSSDAAGDFATATLSFVKVEVDVTAEVEQ